MMSILTPVTAVAGATLTAASTANGTDILCKILLIALVVTLVFGLVQVLGIAERVTAAGAGGVAGRFSGLLVFLVLLLVYVFFC